MVRSNLDGEDLEDLRWYNEYYEYCEIMKREHLEPLSFRLWLHELKESYE